MPGNKCNDNSQVPSTRIARLLRDRELRRSSRASSSSDGTDGNVGSEVFENDSSASSYVEQYLENIAQAHNKGWESPDGRPIRQRLLVVANRLPVSAVRKDKDSWLLEINAGGLVSALLVKDFEARWIGWAGVNVPDEVGQKALTKALAEKRCIPVFLDEEIVHQYYNGYCNNILWPLFHYLGLPQEDRLATTRSFQSQFAAYKKANQMFADVVNKHYVEGDVVWCHDYHLMFLPKCLKERNSKMKVGWFLHTPFPSSEIHKTLPSRSELLNAVIAADLVGFHTYDYARHFVSACTRILGIEATPEGVEDQGRLTRVAAFPIGIDSERFIRALGVPQVQKHMKELKERFDGRKVMLGVDRLDMIKGIPQKLLAFEKFLEEKPSWHDKVVLLQIAVPTRTDVPEYQKLSSQVHEIVGRINGRFGTLTAVPIHHLDRSLDFQALCALYAVTDVALVTSLRDGMNLVSYEFVACQDSKKGVLILSEFAGAAQSLGAGAILVNPWNVTEVAAAIEQALIMPAEEREKRHQHNFEHVSSHTAQQWAEFFVSELNDTVIEAQERIRRVPPQLVFSDAIKHYLQSTNRLLILGFNATLTEPVDTPGRRRGDQIKEMELKLHPELKVPLKMLCNDPNTTIVVLSGSERSVLDDNFGDFDMWLAAENGMFLRSAKGRWMTTMPEHLNMDWVDSVKHVFEYFTARTPRSHFERRETSLVWNYKYTDIEFGRLQARDMLQHLWTGPIGNSSVDVVQGSHSVEMRAVGVTKGAAIERILGEIVHSKAICTPIDYVLCLGHFLGKDEDVYTFFDPDLSFGTMGMPRTKACDTTKPAHEKRPTSKLPSGRSNSKSQFHSQQCGPNSVKKSFNGASGNGRRSTSENISWNVLDLKKENYFSCAVGRTRTNARYLLNTSDDVVAFLEEMVEASFQN
ncbi:alpha,alpha-trehalose-phosphate synthase [UDP-forming] 1 [Olea europaea subsp. europaea]|uniref:alpha,alpha-trehalose-phosphate synthase (UDP-forming) n=1 Tax=Olea europaea subsp. europaea TaxID=158383 RepID=A0A8S0VEY5_OLEEU|nr:alpha,alpha-trehalose-phosphate synthase [UDP-forming] 1 [Olea europaea subsp. europaea]